MDFLPWRQDSLFEQLPPGGVILFTRRDDIGLYNRSLLYPLLPSSVFFFFFFLTQTPTHFLISVAYDKKNAQVGQRPVKTG